MASAAERLKQGIEEFAKGTPPPSSFDAFKKEANRLSEISISQISPDPDQPRKNLGDLSDLKASIQKVGILQPLLVTIISEDRYRLVAGERRYTAAKELGLTKIPAIVRTLEEQQLLEIQIIENVQRKDLSPVEEAQSYKRLMDEFGLTQEQVGERVGKSKSTINEVLRLLTLSDELLEEVRTSEHSKSLLLEIAKQPSGVQEALWQQAKRGELTVKKVRATKQPREVKQLGVAKQEGHFRYPIEFDGLKIIMNFPEWKVTQEEIIDALEKALNIEKARLKSK